MKLGISGFASDGGQSGISQYIINVLPRLSQIDADVELVIFIPRSATALLEARTGAGEIVALPNWLAYPVISVLWHLLLFPVLLKRHACDCAYLPAGNRRLGWWYGMPSVSTIHDLSQFHVAAKYDKLRMFYIKRVMPLMMRRLTRVVAVSESTRQDLINFAGLDGDDIKVAYNGADLSRFKASDKRQSQQRVREFLGTDSPYILYTARLEHPGKNHVRLLQAIALLKQRRALDHKLVLAGSSWNGSEIIARTIEQLELADDVILTGFIANELLPDLYAAADVFVFPSLFEGFGIPLLEAMMAGTPICAANVASIPEVTGDAALLFDPRDPTAMADQIERILLEPATASELVRRGHQQARRFSWDDAARGALQQCREAIAS
jgi:glycosyltransferase involved in cell wall biosynthesis